ncbi:MAG TPA: LysM peptidoglycan-binding domain-containing protein [Burkholderiaceae bacterium]|nr:LysM peptidoglycan-binding domain-containing protein [Burkholderiaceae bacterium]
MTTATMPVQQPYSSTATLVSALFAVMCVGALTLTSDMANAATSRVITPAQLGTAQKVANDGVPLSELAANAPDSYKVKRGDTLWAISKLFLKSPWRWPELWGMNKAEIQNPHLIYPGQMLYLDKSNGRARLSSRPGASDSDNLETVKLSPRTRKIDLKSDSIPTIDNHLIEPFLSEPIIADEATIASAPRFVATQEGRVMLSKNDRAYARSASGTGLLTVPKDAPRLYRVFRDAKPLKDPGTGEVLGYEAQFLGRAELIRGESVQKVRGAKEKDNETEIVPATLDITHSKEEIRTGDRLLPEPPLEVVTFAPRSPNLPTEARIVSVYGSSVANIGQSQIVAINRGARDGIERGHVLAIQSDGARMIDKTIDGKREAIKLPDERNGLLMVFRTFDRLSYALVLEVNEPVKVGDWLINPK